MKRYVVRLEPEERRRLRELVSVGQAAAYKIRHAHILLQADESKAGPGWPDPRIAEGLGVSIRAIEYLRQRFVEQGLAACLERKKREHPPVPAKFDGRQEAKLIALACSRPPRGRERWSLRLLADRVVELKIVDSVSHETVRRVLQKTN
jgi:transposase